MYIVLQIADPNHFGRTAGITIVFLIIHYINDLVTIFIKIIISNK